nr:TnpV protein [uncultured Ruminococcus sp.]
MKKRIYDKQTGIYYELQGDYYLPCLTLPEQPKVEIGVWGKRHLQYIKAHRRGFYTTLLTKCELNRHLADVNKQAEDMFFRLIKQMAERDGVTEQLKAKNQMLWVRKMNNIRNRATEIVNVELIYN